MKLKSNEYQIECTPDGEYYAFLTDYHQCCTYGETAEEPVPGRCAQPLVGL